MPDALTALVTADLEGAATEADHLRYFAAFLAALQAEFTRYLGRPPIDLAADGVGYRTATLNLTDEEFETFMTTLTGLGAKPHRYGEYEGLTFGLDGDIDLANPPVPVTAVLNNMNQVVFTESAVAMAPLPESVANVLGGGDRPLAEDARYAGMAQCLGDVAGAVITAPGVTSAVALYGVGVRRPADLSEKPVNVVCVLGQPTVKPKFTKDVNAKTLKAEVVNHDEVRSGGHTFLRATATLADETRAFYASDLLYTGELKVLADPTELDLARLLEESDVS